MFVSERTMASAWLTSTAAVGRPDRQLFIIFIIIIIIYLARSADLPGGLYILLALSSFLFTIFF